MKIDESYDHAAHIINIKKLIILVENKFNAKDYDGCIHDATELAIEARALKNRLHHEVATERIHTVKG